MYFPVMKESSGNRQIKSDLSSNQSVLEAPFWFELNGMFVCCLVIDVPFQYGLREGFGGSTVQF